MSWPIRQKRQCTTSWSGGMPRPDGRRADCESEDNGYRGDTSHDRHNRELQFRRVEGLIRSYFTKNNRQQARHVMVFFRNGRSIIPRRKCGPGKKVLDGHSIENGLALSVFTFPRRNGIPTAISSFQRRTALVVCHALFCGFLLFAFQRGRAGVLAVCALIGYPLACVT